MCWRNVWPAQVDGEIVSSAISADCFFTPQPSQLCDYCFLSPALQITVFCHLLVFFYIRAPSLYWGSYFLSLSYVASASAFGLFCLPVLFYHTKASNAFPVLNIDLIYIWANLSLPWCGHLLYPSQFVLWSQQELFFLWNLTFLLEPGRHALLPSVLQQTPL